MLLTISSWGKGQVIDGETESSRAFAFVGHLTVLRHRSFTKAVARLCGLHQMISFHFLRRTASSNYAKIINSCDERLCFLKDVFLFLWECRFFGVYSAGWGGRKELISGPCSGYFFADGLFLLVNKT